MPSNNPAEVILGNANRHFTGVTSTLLQTLPHVNRALPLVVLSGHHIPNDVATASFWQIARLCQTPLPDGRWRVFHARRNVEMVQALILKKQLGGKLRIVFTSTAQRHHSRFTRWLMGQMDAVISTCEAAAAYLEKPPLRIIPHGVDTTRFQPCADRTFAWQALGFPGRFGLGIFGRIRPQKGVHLLIDACITLLPEFPHWTLIIAGAEDTRYRGYHRDLQRRVRDAGLSKRIIFTGEQDFDQLPKLFQAMHLVCALSRNEGFGLTVLEAMSSATAVLATPAGAWQELIEPGIQGELLPDFEQQTLNAQLRRMLAAPLQLQQMGVAGRHRVQSQYRIEAEAQQLVELYRELSQP